MAGIFDIFNVSSAFTQKGQRDLDYLASIGSEAVMLSPAAKERSPEAVERREKERQRDVDRAARAQLATEKTIKDMNDRIDRAIEQSISAEREALERICARRENAPKINGEAVYRTRDGSTAYTETGREVSRSEFESLRDQWPTTIEGNHYDDELEDRHIARSEPAKREALSVSRERNTNGELTDEERDELDRQLDDISPNSAPIAHARSGLDAPALSAPFVSARDHAPRNEPATGPNTVTVDPIRPVL